MQKNRKRIGVALGSGGMRGMAHIGVLQVLEEAGIPIDLISGASVGAFFGAAYAAGMDLYALSAYAVRLVRRDVLDLPNPFRSGFFSGNKFAKLCRIVTGDRTFSETCIPFWCSGVDLESGETHYFHSGSLYRAVRASIAIPGLLRPARLEGRTYIDGGTVESIPVDILRQNGADVVIGVDLSITPPYRDPRPNMYRIAFRSVDIMRAAIERLCPCGANVLIRPDVSFMDRLVPHDVGKCIAFGRAAAAHALPEIRRAMQS
ncbi:MAG: patatin-like phospholipase family protein [Clostridia bacterium]|nr:patatin-like phospholipase family protein [Clostridia bacterium]